MNTPPPRPAELPSAGLQHALRLAARDLSQIQPPPQLAASVQLAVQRALKTSTGAGAATTTAAAWAAPSRTEIDTGTRNSNGSSNSAGVGIRTGSRTGTGPIWSAWAGLRSRNAVAGLAVAAVVLVSLVLMLHGPVLDSPPPGSTMARFVPVVPAEQWPADDTPAWLVSTELRADRLAALGLPFDPTRAGDGVRAELLVRASGQVLAVRFIE